MKGPQVRWTRPRAGVLYAMRLFHAFAALAMLASCSAESDERDTNRPATFFYSCVPGDGACKAPFVCLSNPELTGAVCTLSCEGDQQCPAWEATGHCAGSVQSQCRSGVCQYGCD
jgi:hypothetical protein